MTFSTAMSHPVPEAADRDRQSAALARPLRNLRCYELPVRRRRDTTELIAFIEDVMPYSTYEYARSCPG